MRHRIELALEKAADIFSMNFFGKMKSKSVEWEEKGGKYTIISGGIRYTTDRERLFNFIMDFIDNYNSVQNCPEDWNKGKRKIAVSLRRNWKPDHARAIMRIK